MLSGSVYVTGAGGQVGSAVVRRLQHLGIAHGVLPRSYLRAGLELPQEAAVVINCAAYTDVAGAEENQEECWQANADLPANLAMACGLARVPIIHVSTDFIFGGNGLRAGHYNTNGHYPNAGYYTSAGCYTCPRPLGYYAHSKLLGEHAVMSQSARYHNSYCIVRTAGVFTWFSAGARNFPTFLVKQLLQHGEADVVDDVRTQITLASDLADYLVDMATGAEAPVHRGAPRVMKVKHYASRDSLVWAELAEYIAERLGLGKINRVKKWHYFSSRGRDPSLVSDDTTIIASAGRTWKESIDEWLRNYLMESRDGCERVSGSRADDTSQQQHGASDQNE